MIEALTFGLLSFTSFIALINPMGTAPLFLSMTAELDFKAKRKIALSASITAFLTLSIFAFAGQLLFSFFGISVDAFRIAGGIIFFMMGFDMLNARVSRIKYQEGKDLDAEITDIAITPLGIPMLAGPGSITTAIVLMEDADTIGKMVALPTAIALVLFVTFLSMIGASKLINFFGDKGTKIMLKLMGLIVMVIAVEFFFAGLTPIVRNMIGIE
jgi:multiple antibiotic resistance protein